MTEEDLNKLKWQMQSALDCNGYGSVVYKAKDFVPTLSMCITSPNPYMYDGNPEDMPVKRTTIHFMLNGKVYKSKKKLLEALNK